VEKTAALAAGLSGALATADFARLDDVRRLAASIRDRLPRIDVLANNAGASFGRRTVTVDGYEQTLVWLATAAAGWRDGGHHADRSRALVLPSARDDVRARELWDLSAEPVGLPA
jgi:NAD(P)-dependent dehydrogenase (short-subunit alcohol dehydrogenase family)